MCDWCHLKKNISQTKSEIYYAKINLTVTEGMAGASPAIDSISRQQNAANDFWIHGASIFLGHLHVKGCYVLVQNYYRNYSSSSKTSFKTLKNGTRAQPKVILFSLRLWNVTDKTAHPTIKQWKMITKLVSKMNYCSGWPSNVSQAPWTATKKTWGKTKYKYPGNVVV